MVDGYGNMTLLWHFFRKAALPTRINRHILIDIGKHNIYAIHPVPSNSRSYEMHTQVGKAVTRKKC